VGEDKRKRDKENHVQYGTPLKNRAKRK